MRQGEEFYLNKIKHYVSTEWVEVRGAKITKGKTNRQVLKEEASQIERRIGAKDLVVTLDMDGNIMDSLEFSKFQAALLSRGQPITFVIGGPLGLDDSIGKRANETFSLSRLTLTHELCRLVLLEQIYRAFTIIKGEKYHK